MNQIRSNRTEIKHGEHWNLFYGHIRQAHEVAMLWESLHISYNSAVAWYTVNVLFRLKHSTFIVQVQDTDVELQRGCRRVRHLCCQRDKALQIFIVLFR
jgi:hypothetical protein